MSLTCAEQNILKTLYALKIVYVEKSLMGGP